MITSRLSELGVACGRGLRERGETVAVAEGSSGGLISASLLAVPGASAYYLGGSVIYTRAAMRAFLAGVLEPPAGLRGATEAFAEFLAASVAATLGATWGLAEAGAAGPPNAYTGSPWDTAGWRSPAQWRRARTSSPETTTGPATWWRSPRRRWSSSPLSLRLIAEAPSPKALTTAAVDTGLVRWPRRRLFQGRRRSRRGRRVGPAAARRCRRTHRR